jgi:hypothetical protein
MLQLIDALESSRWLIDVSSLLLMLICLIIGRWGVVRLASLRLGLMLSQCTRAPPGHACPGSPARRCAAGW